MTPQEDQQIFWFIVGKLMHTSTSRQSTHRTHNYIVLRSNYQEG